MCFTRVDSDSRLGLGKGEFCKTLEDGLLLLLLFVLYDIVDFGVEPYGVVAKGMDEEVELRLVLVLKDDEL